VLRLNPFPNPNPTPPPKNKISISIRIKIQPLPPLRTIIRQNRIIIRSLSLLTELFLVAPTFAAEEGDEASGDEEEGAAEDDTDYGWDGDAGDC
jgi:hypothetical protein